MRNLLSQQDKKAVLKEYKLRIIIVILVFIFFTMFIASALLAPSYILSDYRYNIINAHSEIIKNSIKKREQGDFGLILRNTQDKLELLSVKKEDILLSKIFEEILEKKSSGIKLIKFSYKKSQNENKDGQIIVSGLASGREMLLRFKKDLEKQENFSEVVLPISNLASDRDIEFSITITGGF